MNDSEAVRRSMVFGAREYIVKPVQFDQFIETVAKIGLYWLLTNRVPQ